MGNELNLKVPKGFRAAATKAGIKPSGGLDLVVIVADGPCTAAGAYTTNRICAAPVKWDRARTPSSTVRALVVNAGNANAATGAQGDENARRTATLAAEVIGCRPDDVLVASTGVIGHQLPMDKLEAGLANVLGALSTDPEQFHEASRAIMTTDSWPKVVSLQETIGAGAVSLLGLAKGAAMIGPRMATMLGSSLTLTRRCATKIFRRSCPRPSSSRSTAFRWKEVHQHQRHGATPREWNGSRNRAARWS